MVLLRLGRIVIVVEQMVVKVISVVIPTLAASLVRLYVTTATTLAVPLAAIDLQALFVVRLKENAIRKKRVLAPMANVLATAFDEMETAVVVETGWLVQVDYAQAEICSVKPSSIPLLSLIILEPVIGDPVR